MTAKQWNVYLKRNYVKLNHVWLRRVPGKIIIVSKLTKDKWKLFQFPLTCGK